MNETNWLPGLLVLGVSAAAGLALAVRRGAPLPTAARTHRDDLLRQKDAAYALLREHEGTRAATPEWEDERAKLEIAAARVLRALDAVGESAPEMPPGPASPSPASPSPASPSPASTGPGTSNPKLVGALWGAGVAMFVGGIAFLVSENATPRAEGASATGGPMAAAPEVDDAALDPLRAAVAANPTDIGARNRLGHALLAANGTMEAYRLSEEVLKIDPADPEARTHQGIVLLNMGDVGLAAKVMDRVLATSPDFTEALMWRGAVYQQGGDNAHAADVWTRAVALDPSLAGSLDPLIAKAKIAPSTVSAPTAPPTATASTASTTSASTPAAPGAASPEDITGSITGDAATLAPGATLFLSARREGVTSGPPVWAQKLAPTSFPLAFRIGPKDRMLDAETPAGLVLTARLDRDGNAATREDGAPQALSATLSPGTSGVVLRLVAK